MAAHTQGEVLLAWLVFSDGQGAKRRPVLVVNDFGDDDLLVAPITSQAARVCADVGLSDWQGAGLKLPLCRPPGKAGNHFKILCGAKARPASGQRTCANQRNFGRRL